MKRLLNFVLCIALCTNVFAAEIINAVPEEKRQEFEEREIIRALGYDPDDENNEGVGGDVLHGPGIDEAFVAICDFIKNKLKKGLASDDEMKEYYKWCGIVTPSDTIQAAIFHRDMIAKKYEAKEEKDNDEKEELTDEEEYGYIYLDVPDINFSKELLNKGTTTAFSILEKAGVDFSYSTSLYGKYVTRIEDKSEKANAGWTYSVNGKAGDVAADKYKCKKNDTITWEYITW